MRNTEGGVELRILSLRCLRNVPAQTGALIGSDREDTFKMAANKSLFSWRPQRVPEAMTASLDQRGSSGSGSHGMNSCDVKTEGKPIPGSLKKRGPKISDLTAYKHIVTLSRNFRQSQCRFRWRFLWKIYEVRIGENVLIVLRLAFEAGMLSWSST